MNSEEISVKNGLRVVLLEEKCLMRNVLLKSLGAWGYAWEAPDDEDAAWAALRQNSGPTMVMVDLHSELVDGTEFLRRARRDHSCYLVAGVPRNSMGGIRACIESGAHDFIYCPYDLDEVRVRLHVIGRIMGLPQAPLTFT
jgi:DNA-binding response OmpR family regulator